MLLLSAILKGWTIAYYSILLKKKSQLPISLTLQYIEQYLFMLVSYLVYLTFSITLPLIGDSLAFLRAEIKSQRKQIKHLKKKSLWCRSLEEVTTDYFLPC